MTTRDRILDAAVDLIRTRGLAHATTKRIAMGANVSEGTIYKQFQDKEELLGQVLLHRMPQFIPALKDLRPGTGTVRANLVRVAALAIEFYRETLPILASLFSDPALLAAQRATGNGPHRANETLAAYLAAEASAGRVRTGDPRAAADLLLGSCFQRAFLDSFHGEQRSTESVRDTATTLVDTLLTGITPA